MKQNEQGDFSMKITVFKYGEALYKAANLFADREGDGKVPLAFCFYLIETGTQKILVDTGCDGRERYGFYTYRAPVEMLADYGLRPEQITDVVITHAHFDHVAEIGNFRHARLYIQKNEYTRGADYIGQWENAVLFDQSAQVAENVTAVRYGGHTPDSCVVYAGKYLLCGDEAYYPRNFTDRVRIGNCADKEKAQRFAETRGGGTHIPLLFHDPDFVKGEAAFRVVTEA